MSSTSAFQAPLTHPTQLDSSLRTRGYAVLSARDVCGLARADAAKLHSLGALWDDLPSDG